MIKLIVSDLDGTLLNVETNVSAKTREIIDLCDSKGICFVPATSRGLSSIPKEVHELATRYLVLSNGAVIYDKENKENLYENLLPFDSLDRLYQLLSDVDYIISVSQSNVVYSEEKLKELLPFGYPLIDYEAEIKFKDKLELKHNLDQAKGIEKLHLNFTCSSERERAFSRLVNVDGWNVSSSWIDNIEVTSVGVDKGEAIRVLQEKMSLSQKEVMTFGDGHNDISMLSNRDFGVAMRNAHPEVQNVASHTTRFCNDEDGLALHIEEYILKNRL